MRDTDRWVTPRVVVAGLLVVGTLLAMLIAATAWLTSLHIDPSPMLDLIREWTTALAAVGALLLQLANRATTAKVERNTGVLASAVYEVADAMPQRPTPRHASDATVQAPAYKAAPGPRGS
jgi:HAMP domain-containing protein